MKPLGKTSRLLLFFIQLVNPNGGSITMKRPCCQLRCKRLPNVALGCSNVQYTIIIAYRRTIVRGFHKTLAFGMPCEDSFRRKNHLLKLRVYLICSCKLQCLHHKLMISQIFEYIGIQHHRHFQAKVYVKQKKSFAHG